MGTIKDRSGKSLVDTEEIKERWKEYMEELYKKDLNDLLLERKAMTNLDNILKSKDITLPTEV